MKRVLLIAIDQIRADSLGCMGHPVVKTPHIDALAADGALFRKHYTCAVPCGPARASMLTGLYPANHRMVTNGTPLDASFTNVALEMREGGYEPTLFGYTDVAPDPRALPADDPALQSYEGVLPGFNVGQLLIGDNKPWLADLKRLGYEVPGTGYAVYEPVDPDREAPPSGQPARFKAEHSETEWLTDRVIDHIDFCGDDPFFIHAAYIKPHPPFIAPAPYHDMYRGADIPAPAGAGGAAEEAAQHPAVSYFQDFMSLDDFVMGAGDRPLSDLSAEDVRNIQATYYGLISHVDDSIGRLVDFLKEKGLYEDTLIILTGDHAEMMGDHGLFGKHNHFEKSYHIPLLIKGAAGQQRGLVVESYTESVDIMPTLLEACGRDVPHHCDGRSLLPLLGGEVPPDWRDFVVGGFDFRDVIEKQAETRFGLSSDQCGLMFIRDDAFKYVHYSGLPPVLYDLEKDPHETRNVAGDPAYAGKMLEYAQKLLSWRMRNEYGALDRMKVSPRGIVQDA